MLDSTIILGIAVVITSILNLSFEFFQTPKGELYMNLIMLLLVGLMQIVNGLLFADGELTKNIILGYFKDGVVLGAAASGVYGMGKEAVAEINANIKSHKEKKANK